MPKIDNPAVEVAHDTTVVIDPDSPDTGQVVISVRSKARLFRMDRQALRKLGRQIEQELASTRNHGRKRAVPSGIP